jgi:predicted dehydrogenase
MTHPLRLGVIGLGRRWQRRYKPALRAMPRHFLIRALYDQIHQKAEDEAAAIGCEAISSVSMLVERKELEALLLCDTQWFGSWSLTAACKAGKPVFCCLPPSLDDVHVDTVHYRIHESKLPVMMDLSPRHSAAAVRLGEILESDLGPAQFLVGDLVLPRRTAASTGEAQKTSCTHSLAGRPLLAFMDWCARVLEASPLSVTANRLAGGDVVSLAWDFGGSRGVLINQLRVPDSKLELWLDVVAEKGSAKLKLPDRLRWQSGAGEHIHLLPRGRPRAVTELEHFYAAVRQTQPLEPTWEDAYRVLGWLRRAQSSLAEGRRLECS